MAAGYSGSAPYHKSNLNTRLSMKLSGILRHGKDGFQSRIDGNGWLEISELLQHSHFCQHHGITYNQIVETVASNNKQRFKISEDGLRIKANQGHTIDIEDNSLQKVSIEKARSYSAVVHGTNYRVLDLILQSGLSKMKRNHIHLTASDRVDASIGVISGFRGSCEILIYIDICKAISDGIEFFVSENNVILCAGNVGGVLERKYFCKVIDRSTNQDVEMIPKVIQSQPMASESTARRKHIAKQIMNLRNKVKAIDKLSDDLQKDKLQQSDLQTDQLEQISKKKEFEESIEKLIQELREMKSNESAQS